MSSACITLGWGSGRRRKRVWSKRRRCLGDRRNWAFSLTNRCYIAGFQGQFGHRGEMAAQLYTVARANEHLEHQAWGLAGQAMATLPLGQIEQAARALNTALSLYASVSASALGETAIQGTLAVLCLRQGQSQLARQAAETTARLLAKTSFPFYSLIDGYTAVADVYLALWEEDLFPASTTSQTQANSPMGALARPACRALHRFARIYPIGQPHAWLCQGLYDWLDGQPAQARNAWRKSLAHAERLAMPYDEGQAHYELGRHASGDERKPHLTRAAEIFERLGAAYDLERTQMAMNAMA